MTYGMPTKYGRQGHAPRCNCPECNHSFAVHNGGTFCTCIDCTYHREINAPAPTNTTPGGYETGAYLRQYENSNWSRGNAHVPQPETERELNRQVAAGRFKRKDRRSMADLKMCERPGCNAIIRGEAVGLLDIMTDTRVKTERKGYELCPACIGDVMGVLDTEPIPGTRQKAYDKPYAAPTDDVPDAVDNASDEVLAMKLFERLMRRSRQKSLESGNGESGEEG